MGRNSAADLSARLAREQSARLSAEQTLHRVRAELATLQAALLETKAARQHALHIACHDPLTSLPNLRFFRTRLHQELSRPRPPERQLAVFYIDLDGFKHVNDMHGHSVGNALLRITASRMRHAVRAQDVVGRIGGDEFACIVDGLSSRAQIRHVACKLFGSICAPLMLGDRIYRMRPSIGIALYPGDAASPETLMESADSAMYAAKRQRIGYAFYDTLTGAMTQGSSSEASCMAT
jgi:diguanylate cyclase (GGDEF)-like protein